MNQQVSSGILDETFAEDDIRESFRLLAESETFSGSDRLIGFLRYVVEEKLNGRGESIRGKSIAMDVYGYDPKQIEKHESVVRVDAGRVRRKLEEYYNSEGSDADLRIDLPKGGYSPVFLPAPQQADAGPETSDAGRSFWQWPAFLAIGTIALLAAVLFWNTSDDNTTPAIEATESKAENLRRSVLFDTSPARLQAENLAEQGRVLIFPATTPARLQAALDIFGATMKVDATYAGGYAGAAQVSGVMALMAPDPELSAHLNEQSNKFARQALELAPDMPWAISARAWTYFAAGEYETAIDWSRRAKELAPDDPYLLEFDALILLYSGKFQEVLDETERLSGAENRPLPFVFQNARSAAFFHLGQYKKSIQGFEAAIAAGAPLGPVSVAYLMAANENLGNASRAESLADKYVSTWPNNRVDLMKKRLFRDAAHSDQLINGMLAAGWQPN